MRNAAGIRGPVVERLYRPRSRGCSRGGLPLGVGDVTPRPIALLWRLAVLILPFW